MKLFLALLLLLSSSATRVDIVIEDSSGVVLKDELVIIQDLNGKDREVLRVLTDRYGKIPALNLEPGVYRAIATAPYGLWQTEVREFLVTDKPFQLTLNVRPMPTHGYGDIVTVGSKKKQLKILQADGKAAVGAELYVRDREATLYLERRYKTNSRGEATIELVGKPTVVAIVYSNSISTHEVSEDTPVTLRLP